MSSENSSNISSKAEIQVDSQEFVFRAVTFFKTQSKHKLRKANKPISYSTARSNMLDWAEKIGLDRTLFDFHSFRSGGATVAANNVIKDRLFKRHGRWKSEKAKDGYVKDSLSELLSVTLNLGLTGVTYLV